LVFNPKKRAVKGKVMDIDNHTKHESSYKELLNNEIVMPEYNNFLEKHGIDLSILTDKSQDITDPLYDRFKFHERCLNVFNKAKKHFYFHRGKIVTFYFTTILDFKYNEWTIDEFLKDSGEVIDDIEILKSKLKIYNYISAALTLILVWTLPALIAQYFFPEKHFGIALIIIGIAGIFIAAYGWDFLSKYISERKNKSIHQEIRKIKLEMPQSL